jgi:hypothetical protein
MQENAVDIVIDPEIVAEVEIAAVFQFPIWNLESQVDF